MYAVLSTNEVVGFSAWPGDGLYRPVVGCFVAGALAAPASCDRAPGEAGEAPSADLSARIGRRLDRALGRTPVSRPPFEGPDRPIWFRMAVAPAVAARLRADDASVVLSRLEDGVRLTRRGAPPCRPTGEASVEALLLSPAADAAEAPDGFAAFLAAPPLHQFEMIFLEYLRRLPEPEARRVYLPRLEAGEITALDLRAILLASDEFRSRRIGEGSRLGAALTSPAWARLAGQPRLTGRG